MFSTDSSGVTCATLVMLNANLVWHHGLREIEVAVGSPSISLALLGLASTTLDRSRLANHVRFPARISCRFGVPKKREDLS